MLNCHLIKPSAYKFLLFLLTFILWSCHSEKENNRAGISLSFDDQSIHEWFELRELFKQNNVKVTFFISEPILLDSLEIIKLKLLEKDGHEIGFHGNIHVISEHYIKENSYASYLKNEIDDGLAVMDSIGFHCRSFAYPYGAKYWLTDFLLLKRFDHIRSVSPVNSQNNLTLKDEVYYSFNGDKTIYAVGFDNNSRLDDSMIHDAMKKAFKEKKVLMLYGHTPTKIDDADGYYFSENRIKYIIEIANQYNLEFYRISDLN